MTTSPLNRDRWAVSCLVADLPPAEALLPYLREIDANRWYTNFGPLQRRFEGKLAKFRGGADSEVHAVTFSSATLALTLTLRALNLGQGARVLLPALTFPATLIAVLDAGLTPVLGDVDAETWVIEPRMAESVLRAASIEAVIPVAAFGYPLALSDWARFQRTTGVRVVVDAAAALGAQAADADVSVTYSLHATKPLGAGEGGVLLTRDGSLAEQARRLSNFGFEAGTVRRAGTNAKLSEYLAAVGLAQIDRAAEILERRRAIFDRYRAPLPESFFRRDPPGCEATRAVPAVLPVHTAGRAAEVIEFLTRRRIETRRWYLPPLHHHAAFESVARTNGQGGRRLDSTEDLDRSLVGIPFHNFLVERDIRLVTESVLLAASEKC